MSFKNRESRECPFKPRRNAKLGGFLTAKNREIIFMSLCPYVFFKPRITRMSFQTAKKREAGGILNREETRNYFYVLMSF